MGDPSALEASSHYFQVAGVISKYEKNEDIWKIKVYVPAEASIRVPMQCWIGEIKTGINDYLLANVTLGHIKRWFKHELFKIYD